jgi:hypothetical protein
VTREWRKVLHNLYSSPGHLGRMEQGLVNKPEGKRPFGRRRHRREDGIRMNLRETGGGCELDLTSSGYGPVTSYRYISIHFDQLIPICLDGYIWVYLDRLLSIYYDRSILIYLDRLISIYLDRLKSIYHDRYIDIRIEHYRRISI